MKSPELELIRPSFHQSFVANQWTLDSFNAPWHYHPEWEITYIHKSNGMRYVGYHIEPFSEGDLVLLGAGVPHVWKNPPMYI